MKNFALMIVGRVIFGLGGESQGVAQVWNFAYLPPHNQSNHCSQTLLFLFLSPDDLGGAVVRKQGLGACSGHQLVHFSSRLCVE
jgi:hypothetical protein